MSWDVLTMLALGLFGFLALVVTLVTSLLKQQPELVAAWRSLVSSGAGCTCRAGGGGAAAGGTDAESGGE
ncbi:hypothetical protein DEJ45_04125 [Streptomyces venezuelae]|uniref:hypothetical protein n=1 Tax=Streptomyces venezuelae TaxID=54571 RepID=UPI00123CCDD1|nr:hypothetical protein [Streptomyces venezuelae]QES11678.1 hypothetical protein DEJ45_04125 [Streptomyces venezuelae]